MMRSLFSGVSGLKNHQTRMDVIGNNIANVNTAGFKGSRVTFQDMLSQSMSAASSPQGGRGGTNPQQVGLGMGLSSIDTYFGNGNVQSTGKNTDLCISDNGFFIVADGDTKYYTRAGGFEFDTQGNYGIPGSGLRVQGWMADALGNINTSGQPTNIVVPTGQTMPAKASDSVTFGKNLSAEGNYATTTIKTEMTNLGYAGAKPVVGDPDPTDGDYKIDTVTDSKWDITATREVTYSPGAPPATDATLTLSNQRATEWKYTWTATIASFTAGDTVPAPNDTINGFTVVAVNPSPPVAGDPYTVEFATTVRTDPNTAPPTPPTGYATGTGAIAVTQMSATLTKKATITGAANDPKIGGNYTVGADNFIIATKNATAWDIKSSKTESRPTRGGDVSGTVTDPTGLITTTMTLKPATVKTSEITAYDSQGVAHKITVNFTKTADNVWTVTPAKADTSTGYPLVPAFSYQIRFNTDGTFLSVDNTDPITFAPDQADAVSIAVDFSALTQYSGETTATVTDYTGYAAGALKSVSIDKTGTIIGKFTNNLTRNLGQVALATFNNPTGLTKSGNSLYSESNNSGIPQVSTADNGGAGSITPSSLEMSNVDLSDEFSNMIITQRGFQSNSKIITVSDEMLDTLIGMKR